MKFLSDLKNKDLSGKTCLLRVDLNLTNDDLKKQKNHLRITAVLPTIKFLINRGAKVVILSHRGRPKVKTKNLSLKPFTKILSSLLKKPIAFITLNDAEKKIKNSSRNSIFLMENLRFFSGEDKNDQKFAKKLASLGTFYVNDTFAFSHRPTASIVGIPKFLPSYAGLALEKELENIDKAIKKQRHPFIIILGGAKISDKIGMIKNFLKKADYFLLGGGVANTFFAGQGLPIDHSLYGKEMLPLAKKLLKSRKIILPIDSMMQNGKILDIGPQTVKKYTEIIKKAKTIVWNGPMGYIEEPRFAKGSKAVAGAIIKSRAFSVIGGGETTSLLKTKNYKLKANIFVFTAGGAMLEYLSGKKLPGLTALKK